MFGRSDQATNLAPPTEPGEGTMTVGVSPAPEGATPGELPRGGLEKESV